MAHLQWLMNIGKLHQSNRSLRDPCETGANRFAPLALEEGEIESDSDCNVRQKDKDPSPSKMDQVLNILRHKLPRIPEPKPEVFKWTLKNTSFKLGKHREINLVATLVNKYRLRGRQKDLAEYLIQSAFSLMKARNYKDHMNFHFNYFNGDLDWNISIEGLEAIIVHIFCLAGGLNLPNGT